MDLECKRGSVIVIASLGRLAIYPSGRKVKRCAKIITIVRIRLGNAGTAHKNRSES